MCGWAGRWTHSQPCRCDNIDDYKDVAGNWMWLKPGIPAVENGLKVGFYEPSQGSWQGAGREFFRCSPEISQTHHLLGVGRNQWCHIPAPPPAPQEGLRCHAFLCLLLNTFSQLMEPGSPLHRISGREGVENLIPFIT